MGMWWVDGFILFSSYGSVHTRCNNFKDVDNEILGIWDNSLPEHESFRWVQKVWDSSTNH